ncbi:MAG: SGNH/GDSL hydrolase family protein [Candidatus Eiseniibacteriota bacterium]
MRSAAALGVLLWLPIALAVDGGLALAAGWSPRGAGRALVPVCLGLLAGGAALLALPRTRSWLARRLGAIALAGAGLLLALALGELVVRPFRPIVVDELTHLRPPGLEQVYHPDPAVMPGVRGDSRYEINSLGVRGDDLPPGAGTYRVLCVGGSSTECLYLDQDEAWPTRLQASLRTAGRDVWVGNAGISGYATPYHIRFVRASSVAAGMDCFVFLVAVNDLLWWLGERSFASVPPDPEPVRRPFALSTGVGRLVAAAAQRLERPQGPGVVEDEAGENYVERRRERADAAPFEELEPPLESYVAYAARLDHLVVSCRERGQRAILVTHPVLWREGMPPEEEALLWLGRRKGGAYVSAASLRRIIDRYNELARGVAAKRGAEIVDLSDLSGDPRWFYDDCHFNEAGAAEVARRLAEHFLRAALPD